MFLIQPLCLLCCECVQLVCIKQNDQAFPGNPGLRASELSTEGMIRGIHHDMASHFSNAWNSRRQEADATEQAKR